ncbi:MAG: 2,3-bisphosphoglycerate-independent phosphoglycerate mutase, partial [Desulfobacterales bacterium]
MLIILDGWGYRPENEGNAISLAHTPFLDSLQTQYPQTHLLCAGEAVGLPPGTIGNSEVGHLNIGAGRVVCQNLLRINSAIQDGSFLKNEILNSILSKIKANHSALHLMGLVSDGGVHSHVDHLFALLDTAIGYGLRNIYIHAILDGRDAPPDSGVRYMQKLQNYIHHCGTGTIASICGRYFAMDRDGRWDRTEKSYRLFTRAEGKVEADPVQAIKNAYRRNESDEFVKPITIQKNRSQRLPTV